MPKSCFCQVITEFTSYAHFVTVLNFVFIAAIFEICTVAAYHVTTEQPLITYA